MKYPKKESSGFSVSENKESYDSGYRLFYRSIENHKLVGFEKPYSKAEAWQILIWETWGNKDRSDERMIQGKLFIIGYGELIVSRRYLAKRWGWGERKVRTFLQNLIKLTMIITKNDQNLTRISIVNFDTYQYRRPSADPAPTQRRPKENTYRIRKNTREGDKTAPTPAEIAKQFFQAYIDPDYRESEYEKYANRLGSELSNFCNYWTEPTKSGKKQKWETYQTWEIGRRIGTWIKNQDTFKSNGQHEETFTPKYKKL